MNIDQVICEVLLPLKAAIDLEDEIEIYLMKKDISELEEATKKNNAALKSIISLIAHLSIMDDEIANKIAEFYKKLTD